MTTDLATHTATLHSIAIWSRPDPVRARVKLQPPPGNFEMLPAEAFRRVAEAHAMPSDPAAHVPAVPIPATFCIG